MRCERFIPEYTCLEVARATKLGLSLHIFLSSRMEQHVTCKKTHVTTAITEEQNQGNKKWIMLALGFPSPRLGK